MDEPAPLSEQAIVEAVKKGGPAAAFELLAKVGVGVDQAPEPGIGARMRSGAGTEDAFSITQHLAGPDRPHDWPADLPFLPDAAAAVTRFDRPGRGLAVQWWNVPDPAAAAALIVRDSEAAGWCELHAPPQPDVFASTGQRVTHLERGGVTRTVMAVALKRPGLVALTER